MDSVVASEAIDPGSTPGARTSLRAAQRSEGCHAEARRAKVGRSDLGRSHVPRHGEVAPNHAAFFFAFDSCQARQPSQTIGSTESTMIARITSLKFFCTSG
jgi:hypothetical protein